VDRGGSGLSRQVGEEVNHRDAKRLERKSEGGLIGLYRRKGEKPAAGKLSGGSKQRNEGGWWRIIEEEVRRGSRGLGASDGAGRQRRGDATVTRRSVLRQGPTGGLARNAQCRFLFNLNFKLI
jgi:hypothetical protein